MKEIIKNIIAKMSRMSVFDWKVLILLMLGMVMKSMAVGLWDIGAASALLHNGRLFTLGVDMMGVAVLMSAVGCFIWRLDRSKGRGALKWITLCCALAMGSVFAWETTDEKVWIDMIFILKYGFWFVLTIAFWGISRRFIRERLKSLRFLTLFCWELAGMSLAGLMTIGANLDAIECLVAAVACMLLLLVVSVILALLLPLPIEMFVRREPGIQDVFEKPLVWGILSLACWGTLAKALGEVILYFKLAETGISPETVLGLVWILFGGLGLMMIAVLYRTRYIYTTLAGMLVFGLSIIMTGVLDLGRHSGPIASSYLIILIGTHFYLNGYLRILPRILSGGVGPRLKKKIMTLATPLGFVMCGIVCLNLKPVWFPYVLILTGMVIIGMTLRTAMVYAQILMRMFEMRVWRGGPLMISYNRLLGYLKRLLTNENADDAIYALQTLEAANHPAFEPSLVQAVSHKKPAVRLFAVRKMRGLKRFGAYHALFKRAFDREKENAVRYALFTNLILTDGRPNKYAQYLYHRNLAAGAVTGFLKLGGDLALQAMAPLQKLAYSKNVKEVLAALDLMAEYPNRAFVRWVGKLLKHPNITVVQQALLTAGRLKASELLPVVFRALDDPELAEYALTALASYGQTALPPIERMLMKEQTPAGRRKTLILFLGSRASSEGKLILIRALGIENQKLKKTIVQNILDSGIIWLCADVKNTLKKGLKDDIDRVSWLLHLREKLGSAPTHESEEAFGFFLRALEEDITDTRELILYQMLLLNNSPMFAHAVRLLLGESYDLFLPALGVVQDMIPHRLYQKLKPVLVLPLSQKKKEPLLGVTVEEAVKTLGDVIVNPPYALNHWIRATALYALRRLGDGGGVSIAEKALADENPVVLEAAVWALVRLEDDREKLHRQLLALPTSQLARISLDEILES